MSTKTPAESFLELLSGSAIEPLWLPVLSGSMSPTLIPGDSVLVQGCTAKDCAPGDIIIFRQGATLSAHRFICRVRLPGKTLFFQQGDGMNDGDFTTPEKVVGRAVKLKRDGVEFPLTDSRCNRVLAGKQRVRLLKYIARRFVSWILKKGPISR